MKRSFIFSLIAAICIIVALIPANHATPIADAVLYGDAVFCALNSIMWAILDRKDL